MTYNYINAFSYLEHICLEITRIFLSSLVSMGSY